MLLKDQMLLVKDQMLLVDGVGFLALVYLTKSSEVKRESTVGMLPRKLLPQAMDGWVS